MPKIDYSELQTVSAEVKRLRRGIVTQFTAFTAANQTFQGSADNLTGDSWDSARAYFAPYEEVASSIYNALYDVDDVLSNYLNDFVSSVGAAENRLDTDKLEALRSQLREEQTRRSELDEAMAAAFKDIPFIGKWFLDNSMVETSSKIAILEKYQAFEGAHAGDFSGLCTTMQAVKSGIEFLGSAGNFAGGKDGFKLVDYSSTTWYQTLKKVNDVAPKDRYEILEAEQGYKVFKNGVLDNEKTKEYNWLITHKNWDMLKELGPEIIKIWLNLDDVEVLLDDGSSTLQKSTASIFLLMSILPADEIEALIKAAKLIKNGDTTIDTIKLSSASWEALKEAHAAAKVVKKMEIADDVVDAGKVANIGVFQNRINDIRNKMPNNPLKNKGNMAIADVNIKGLPEEFIAHSKINSELSKGADLATFSKLKPESDRIFKNYEPSASTIDGLKFDRFHDTEAKILEDIASQITDPNMIGSIDLFTELPACQSCSNIVLEFRNKFPNVKLNIFTK